MQSDQITNPNNHQIKVKFAQAEDSRHFTIENATKEVKKAYVKAFGSDDSDLSCGLATTLTNIAHFYGDANLSADEMNSALTFLQKMQANDPIESMLLIQMYGNHFLSTRCLQKANISNQTFQGSTENINRATKLSRTFMAQMEALKKYRNKDGQKIKVEHVNVNKGGKAVINSTINQQNNNKDAKN
jgi:hypothetical protein